MVRDAILLALETSDGAVSFERLRQMLSQVSHVSLRFYLCRLQERGSVELVGEDYWLMREPQHG